MGPGSHLRPRTTVSVAQSRPFSSITHKSAAFAQAPRERRPLVALPDRLWKVPMANKMLIDAAHPEETRVVVVRGSRVEEFDFESANRRQLRGNIYLAKVTRVEPSLQAAFVEYGGNRHGFLAFSEIHPDYYQIPVADRQALIEAEEREAHAEEAAAVEAEASEDAETEADGETSAAAAESHETADGDDGEGSHVQTAPRDAAEDVVESVGAGDALEELPERRKTRAKQYKIQEVIRRRQVLLVQVVKEERGNKGAALTTYLSLAGRYSVLMPNTARGGGISRKITNAADRKRLKDVAADLEVPEGMGVILRTAGASRTKAEVKRDFEYLLRLWENVRELTLRSSAPSLVYEEGSLIKRSIRDLYNKDIDEVLVAGDEGYREAKDFMRMLMPSHAKNVQPYRENQPLFARNGIEHQLDAMFSPQVTLKSGGYIVINQTEALVAIDVNSGRSTREHNIEDTAYQTNLEAADEVARQMRLRDLAGLIVIDFIDMEEKRNNRSVERRLKEALKNDRARIQVGRISHFGLLEMSRQRIRTGVLESTTELCPHCQGTGHVRSPSSVALHVLRSIEDNLLKGVTHDLIVHTRTAVALYILNQKRAHLSELEQRFGLSINITADETVNSGAHFVLERGEPVGLRPVLPTSIRPTSVQLDELIEEEEPEVEEIEAEEPAEAAAAENGDGERRKRRRRRRRRGNGDHAGHAEGEAEAFAGEDEAEEPQAPAAGDEAEEEPVAAAVGDEGESAEGDGDEGPRRRRRGRRGGRRSRRGQGEDTAEAQADEAGDDETLSRSREIAEAITEAGEALPDEIAAPALEPAEPAEATADEPPVEDEAEHEPVNGAAEPVAAPEPAEDLPPRPKRGGWWQRRSFF